MFSRIDLAYARRPRRNSERVTELPPAAMSSAVAQRNLYQTDTHKKEKTAGHDTAVTRFARAALRAVTHGSMVWLVSKLYAGAATLPSSLVIVTSSQACLTLLYRGCNKLQSAAIPLEKKGIYENRREE